MAVRSLRATCLFGLLIALAACRTATPHPSGVELHPKPPTAYPGPDASTEIVLELEAGEFHLVAVRPRRDRPVPFDLAEHLDELRAGDAELFEYRATSHGALVNGGSFVAVTTARVTFETPGHPGQPRHTASALRRVVVSILVPSSALADALEVDRVDFVDGTSEREWKRTAVARIDLGAGAAKR